MKVHNAALVLHRRLNRCRGDVLMMATLERQTVEGGGVATNRVDKQPALPMKPLFKAGVEGWRERGLNTTNMYRV